MTWLQGDTPSTPLFPFPKMKPRTPTLIIGGLLLAIFLFLLFAFQVRTTEVAVVTTFGSIMTAPAPRMAPN